MKCTARVVSLSLGITGLVLLILGIIVKCVVVPNVVREKIAEILPLRNNTESWDRWKDLPIPIEYRIYVFEIENPDEVVTGALPKVKEVGPYVYNEKRVKTILEYDEKSGFVVYDHKILFEFNKTASHPLSDEDVLTVLNPIAMLFGLVVDNMIGINPVIQLYNTAIHKMWPHTENPLFVKTSVKDLIFEGMPMYCNQSVALENFDTKILCEAFRILRPKTVTLDYFTKNVHSFSFFKYKNNTSDGIYKIDLGIYDVTKIGRILSWNSVDTLSIWKGESCNKIQGTDMTVFRPYLEQDDVRSLFIYNTDACRSIELTYDSDSEFKGVRGRRYVPSYSFLRSVVNDSNNHCFCPQSVKGTTHYAGCLRDGSLELTGCQGAPVTITYPHFINAHPSYQKVEGLKPDINKHGIFLDLEPNSGYPLRGANRIQINAFLKSIPEVNFLKSLPNVLMPIIWMEEKVELTDELIDTINSQLLNLLKIADGVTWFIIAMGLVLGVESCCYYFFKVRQGNNKSGKRN